MCPVDTKANDKYVNYIMPTAATSNYGSIFTFGGATWPCMVVDFPEISTDQIEITNHASGGVREKIPSGLLAYGDITLSMIAAAGTLAAFKTYMQNKTISSTVVSNNTDTLTGDGFFVSVKAEAADAQSPDANKLTVTIASRAGWTIT